VGPVSGAPEGRRDLGWEMSFLQTGGCACGAVRFEVEGPLEVGDCHCRMCQRAVGAAYVTWASADAAALRLVQGEPRWWRSSASAERGFCAWCGTSLFFRSSGRQVDITVAAFDEPALLPPTFAIWTTSRLPWVHLDAQLPAFEDAGPDWQPEPPSAPPADTISWREGREVDLVQLGQLFGAVGFSRSTDLRSLRAVVDGARWVVSAWRGDELVGFARAISDGVSNAYVSAVAVRPDLQRQGIGRGLLQRLLAGRDDVKFVLRTSDAGEPLYRAFGFEDATRMLVRPRAARPARGGTDAAG
jgi:GNAT superfamily N-acetyltransferase